MARIWRGLNWSVHEGLNDILNVKVHLKTRSRNVNIQKIDKTQILMTNDSLKCLISTFNIFLESKINISLCTDLIFTDHLFIC